MKFNVDNLVAQGLVHKKTYTDGPYAGLSVLKYKNNVFWDNLWHKDARLLDCRGMVVDAEDNVVIWPFTKIFNRFENNTNLPDDRMVDAVRKVNGFMAAASLYNGEILVSTTGTLDSDFAKMAKEHIVNSWNRGDDHLTNLLGMGVTLVFEICDATDPHIVDEKPGAYLIGCRFHNTGTMMPEIALDGLVSLTGWQRPKYQNSIPFGDVVKMADTCSHEGFVVRDPQMGTLLLKIKSPHYLAKKFLMRGGDNKWDMIWDNPQTAKQRIDEEYYELLDHIREYYTKEAWSVMDSQQRRKIVEDYFAIEDLFNRGSRFYVGVAR